MGGLSLENRNEVGERGMGKLYDIMAKAKADRDIEAFNGCIMMTGNSSSTHPAA